MALADLTREAVLRAMAEYNELGGEDFLNKYGYRPARSCFLLDDEGRRYPSKAIAGVAHGYISPNSNRLDAADFKGGEKTVARKLRELRFEVTEAAVPLVDAPFEPEVCIAGGMTFMRNLAVSSREAFHSS